MRPFLAPRARAASTAVIAGLFALPCTGSGETWIEVRSSHFVIDSALGESRTRNLAQDLEGFRVLVGTISNITQLDERVPTRIFAFAGVFPELGLTAHVGGYFDARMRDNIATMRPVPGMPLAQVLQHEYTHFLVHNRDSRIYPPWFDEGLAEVMSTANVRDKAFRFGEFPPDRTEILLTQAWLPMATVVDVRPYRDKMTESQSLMFEPQAMLLTHYLMIGRPNTDFGKQNAIYLGRVEDGGGPVAAFEEAFGEPVAELGHRLNNYLHRAHYFTGELTKGVAPPALQVTKLEPDTVDAYLGDIALARGNLPEAGRYYRSASGNPANAAAIKGLAEVASLEGRVAEAEALYAKAIELDPKNDLHHLDYAEHLLRRAEKATEADERSDWLLHARKELVAAHDLNGDNPETLAIYGSSFLLPGETPSKGLDTLTLAHQLLPSNTDISMRLAKLHLALDRPDDARPLLRRVVAWSHSNRQSSAAAELLEKLDRKATAVPADTKSPSESATAH